MEHPKRPLRIWSLDVGKQGTGMMAAHLCGMGAAILLAHIPFHQRSSECAWYVFTFLFDTCIGTGLSLALHWAALWAAARPSAPPALSPLLRALTPCGDYGEPASALRWVSQTLEWVFCVVLARGVCLGLAAAFSPLLGRLAVHLDAAFEGRPRLFLVFVMLICPLLVNTAQVLIQDAYLRWTAAPESDMDAETEPLQGRKHRFSPSPGGGRGSDTGPPSSTHSQSSEVQLMVI
ncbi:hypothetical protein QBZ16_003730 [Prototheca wickerhamii]|uniref:Uncharacterized protein n=1 Tax=Prototheca wickerhamii TaxID=3111 RepID=A0AAD9IKX4_PROWI|nr:hypothetical protein QBZ16_003730 [Prototheca wickerhamii]